LTGHYQRILRIAVFYTGAVAIVDYFLAKTPMINWLTLGFVFLFFAALIVDSVVRLLAKEELVGKILHRQVDDLERLKEIIERALAQGQSESLKSLENRLRSLALAARDYGANRFGRQLDRPNESALMAQLLTGSSLVLKNLDAGEIETLLAEIEAWLS
jgi:hypothetical protein